MFKDTPPSLLLKKFTFNPDMSSKHLNILFMTSTFWVEGSPMKRVSSANWRSETSTSLPILKPLNKFLRIACLIMPFRPSATIKKRNGAKGSPCLKPLCIGNSSVGLPLTKTEIVADCKHPRIHPIHLSQNPSRCNMYSKKFQFTES